MNTTSHSIGTRLGLAAALATAIVASATQADEPRDQEMSVRYRVTGLFQPDRVDDLREAMKSLPEVTLVNVDYATSEATFRFDATQAFPGVKPAQLVEPFNNRLRGATNGTFGIRALSGTPREKLRLVEIPIVGLDCKGCSFGAYDAVYQLDGVEQAQASFKDGLVIAWIDPQKTDRTQLEAALMRRRVTLRGDP